ncbi:major facilitator superfamily domain-containing protein [Aspergillus similis]
MTSLNETDVVDWDGPDDPANPLNWPKAKKKVQVIFVSIFTLYANLAATMFAPGAAELANEFHLTNSTIEAFTVSIYVLGFALGPLLLAPLSELYGRLIIYHICNLFYFAFTAGCAFSTDVAMFLVFRFICGCAASGPMSMGGGTVADVTSQEERGKAMALFSVGPLLGPVIGRVVGGFVSENIGWRWTFRIILIMSGVLGIIAIIFLRETNAKVLLQRKAKQLSIEAGKAEMTASNPNETPWKLLCRSIFRPVKMLLFSPIVLFISLYSGTLFGVIFLLFSTLPTVFEADYHFGLILFAVMSDKLLGQKRGGTVARPEERLILMKWLAPITPLGCFLYGWSTYYHLHWIIPILGTFVIGIGAFFIVMPAQVYLVDAFGAEGAASALAANLVVRSPFGAFLALAAPALYDRLGLGWGNSVLGFICFAFTPVPWLFYRYGEYLRTRFAITL